MDDGKVPVGRISLPSFLRYLGGEGESKKLNFRIPDPKYLRLFCVNLQKEFLLGKVSDPFKQPFGRFSAFCKENSVIRIADRPNPFAFKLFVKFMQKNVSQQWRDNTSLRGADGIGLSYFAFFTDRCTQEFMNQRHTPSILNPIGQQLDELTVIHCVEELP